MTRRSRPVLLAVFGIVLMSLTVPAFAHNGVGAAFKGTAGPYIVYAYDGYINAGNELEYRLILLDPHQQPVQTTMRVGVTATPLDQPHTPSKSVRATSIQVLNNVVFYDLPNPYPGDWRVHLTLAGALGRGAVTYRMHGAQPINPADANAPLYTVVHTGPPTAVVAAGIIGAGAVVILVGLLIWKRRTRPKSIR